MSPLYNLLSWVRARPSKLLLMNRIHKGSKIPPSEISLSRDWLASGIPSLIPSLSLSSLSHILGKASCHVANCLMEKPSEWGTAVSGQQPAKTWGLLMAMLGGCNKLFSSRWKDFCGKYLCLISPSQNDSVIHFTEGDFLYNFNRYVAYSTYFFFIVVTYTDQFFTIFFLSIIS